MSMSYLMKVSRNGQVSIPAAARARWHADQVVVVDLGDRVVMRPLSAGGIDGLVGKYADSGPTSDELRRRARADDDARTRRKRGR